MNALSHTETSVPSENWDDDFEFQQYNATERNSHEGLPSTTFYHATSSSATDAPSRFSEDWDAEPDRQNTRLPTRSANTVLEDKMNYFPTATRPFLESPSTPTRASKVQATPSRLRRHHGQDSDNDSDADRQRQQNPADYSPSKRVRRNPYPETSDDDFAFVDIEEDQTVTAFSRPKNTPFNRYSSPSVDVTMAEPFPLSPSGSVFSIPGSGHDSVRHSSASHLVACSALATCPAPPAHRERRRLRKKSRPSGVDDDVFEMQDRVQAIPSSSTSLSPPRPSTPVQVPNHPPAAALAETTSPGKLPLLSRIGSVKKWGVRKKRTSTPPSEAIQDTENETTPRPPSSLAQSSLPPPPPPPPAKTGNWFFRSSSVGSESGAELGPGRRKQVELDDAESVDKPRRPPSPSPHPSVEMEDPDATPKARLGKKKSFGFVQLRRRETVAGVGRGEEVEEMGIPRRPTSMLPNASARAATYAYGVTTSTSASGTSSVEDLKKPEREGSRGFMGSVRRVSLIGQKRHKRTKSSGAMELTRSTPALLPPIEFALGPNLSSELNCLAAYPPPATHRMATQLGNGFPASYVPPRLLPEHSDIGLDAVSNSTLSGQGTAVKVPAASVTPQIASLGRTASPIGAAAAAANGVVPRRSSLGDLKIPTRISQAQVGLRRDLGMVREFAANVEQLKEIQATHAALTEDIQTLLDHRQQSIPTSPTLFHLPPLPGSRPRSYTNPLPPQKSHRHLISLFDAINAKYRILWECAELLIELGGGASVSASASGSPPPTSVSAPIMHSRRGSVDNCRKSRERAISLVGGETTAAFPNHPNLAWRGTTGRNDLSQRQMNLLKEMMGNVGDPPIPEESMVNREWRWGDAMSSSVTLPSEESEGATMVPKRGHKLGIRGLRDMLKSLVKSYTSPSVLVPPTSLVESCTGTESSLDREPGHLYDHPHIAAQRRRAKASHDPELMKSVRGERPGSPHHAATLLKQKSSPRRPSLASIFRFGQKSGGSSGKQASMAGNDKSVEQVQPEWVVQTQSSGQDGGSSNGNTEHEEEDWDQMDSISDLEASNVERAAVRGKLRRPRDDRRGSCPGPSSRNASVAPLTNVEEGMDVDVDDGPARYRTNVRSRARASRSPSPSRSASRKAKARVPKYSTGTLVRPVSPPVPLPPPPPPPPPPLSTLPPSGTMTDADARLFAEVKVAMTPENIRPLLENAREVLAKLRSCNGELRLLLAM